MRFKRRFAASQCDDSRQSKSLAIAHNWLLRIKQHSLVILEPTLDRI